MNNKNETTFVHANMKGTGSAVSMTLRPTNGDRQGSIFLSIALQNTVGGIRNGVQVFPTFDWEDKIVVQLKRDDIVQIMQVLRGMRDSICDGKGLFHHSATSNTIIKFSDQEVPRRGYLLTISRKWFDGRLKSAHFMFDVDEAFALMLILEQSMLYLTFGIPKVEQPTTVEF